METLCSIGHARGFLWVGRGGGWRWSRSRGGGGGAAIPARERSLRAATSHSRLPGDRGATDTRLGARGARDPTLLYNPSSLAVSTHAEPQVRKFLHLWYLLLGENSGVLLHNKVLLQYLHDELWYFECKTLHFNASYCWKYLLLAENMCSCLV